VRSHIAVAALLIAALGTPVRAQERPPSNAPNTVRIQVLLSRYQGEKKLGSLPYTLSIQPDDRSRSGHATVRLGTQVPITTTVRQSGEANAPSVPTVQYRDVGTSIDCTVVSLLDGRFKVDISVEDSSVDTPPAGGSNPAHPPFRSFRTSDSLLLTDGQSAQFSTATDRVSGDVWKVDVTLTVVK